MVPASTCLNFCWTSIELFSDLSEAVLKKHMVKKTSHSTLNQVKVSQSNIRNNLHPRFYHERVWVKWRAGHSKMWNCPVFALCSGLLIWQQKSNWVNEAFDGIDSFTYSIERELEICLKSEYIFQRPFRTIINYFPKSIPTVPAAEWTVFSTLLVDISG